MAIDIGNNFNYPTYLNNNVAVIPNINTVGQVDEIDPVFIDKTAQPASFKDFLQDAITNTVGTDYETKKTDLGLLLGETQDLHSITMAGEKAEVVLNLTVQIRDRMLEAYQEIMRMQV